MKNHKDAGKPNSLFVWILLILIAVPSSHFAATRILHEDFETGPNWQCGAKWDRPGDWQDEWDIVSKNPHGGSYCAQGKEPGVGALEDSWLEYGKLPKDATKIFFRYWRKHPPNYLVWRQQTMRWIDDAQNQIEIGSPYGSTGHTEHRYCMGTPMREIPCWNSMMDDTNWSEYAILIDYQNGKIIFWKNAKAYTANDPSAHVVDFNHGGCDPFYKVGFGAYNKGDSQWKSECGSRCNYVYWIDDIEIWRDGVPGGSNDVSLLEISTSSLPSATLGTAYSQKLAATGGKAPYSWSVQGSLPAGLTFSSSTGTITGTPIVTGYSTFTVQVKDASSPANTATRSYSIMVRASTALLLPAISNRQPGNAGSVTFHDLSGRQVSNPTTMGVYLVKSKIGRRTITRPIICIR